MLLQEINFMKKIITSLFLILGFSLVLFSQEENKTSFKNHYQLGLNISSLVKSLSNKNNPRLIQEIISYKYVREKVTFRAGIGGVFQKEIGDDFGSSINRHSLAIRMGFEKQKNISKKWQYYYGSDLKYKRFNEDTFNDFLGENISKLNRLSLSPLLGFQFQLTPHLFLQTEASINFYYEKSNITLNDFSLPISDPIFIGDELKEKGVNITLPNVLFLVVKF